MIKHPKKPIFEFNEITNYIYIGTNQCCTIHFNNKLLKKGVKADISLEKKRLDQPFGVNYYLWLPTSDHKAPTLNQLFLGVSFIKNLVDKKIPVYVHCTNGHGRAPVLVAAYFVLEGKTIEQAINLIKKKRPSIHPNKFQLNKLKSFELALKNKK